MNGIYNIEYGGKQAGKLKVYGEGIKTVFSAETEFFPGILRLAAVSNGRVVPIGVLSPGGKGLCLKKSFSRNTLDEFGLRDIDKAIILSGEDEKAKESAWSELKEPGEYFADPDLKSSCKGARGVLVSNEGELTRLAFPLRKGSPFALMPAFCLGNPAVIEGNEYLIFKIKNGSLSE